MNHPLRLLDKKEDILEMVRVLSSEPVIGIDTEFIRETTFFPKIALLQVAGRERTFLVDPTRFTKEDLIPLLDLFSDTRILKVMHAAYADQECLYYSYGVVADPVVDTAVAAGLLGMGDSIGLQKLLRETLKVHLPKGRARVKWLQRPLSNDLIQYAEQDVAHLVKLWQTLEARLQSKGRVTWALDESHVDPAVFEPEPAEIANRLSRNAHLDAHQYGSLKALIEWRESRARKANLPRGWVAENETLLSLAKVRPRTMDDLRSFRGINPKEIERSGKDILDAVTAGDDSKETAPATRHPIPSVEEDHVLDFVLTYVAYLAAQHEICAKYLLGTAKVAQLIHRGAKGPEEWVKEGILSENARELIGNELFELLRGNRALRLQSGKVAIVQL